LWLIVLAFGVTVIAAKRTLKVKLRLRDSAPTFRTYRYRVQGAYCRDPHLHSRKQQERVQPQSWLILYVISSPTFAIEIHCSLDKHHYEHTLSLPTRCQPTYHCYGSDMLYRKPSASLASPSHSPRATQSSTAMARSPSRKRPTAVSHPLRSIAPVLLRSRVVPLAETHWTEADKWGYRRRQGR